MIPHTSDSHGPFVVVVTDTGARMKFEHLTDANRYMSVQLNVNNRTTAVYDRHGQLVGCTETFLDGGPVLGSDAA